MHSITVTPKGVGRLRQGHPWVYRSDLRPADGVDAGLVRLADQRGRGLGTALFSPHSEIRVRWLAAEGVTVDAGWWRAMVAASVARREGIADTGWRAVHAEADGLPSLIVDRYGEVAVAQLLSAGLEAVRDDVIAAIREVLRPAGLLLRNDPTVRQLEHLPRETTLAFGEVPDRAPYTEGRLALAAAPRTGQKTGAFLDQRTNRQLVGRLARGRCLDVFCYHGGFALQLAAGGAAEVTALDSSAEALAVLRETAAANGLGGIRTEEANAFDWLHAAAAGGDRTYDVIVLDPPAFAREKRTLAKALAGYKELNLRAMRLLAPGGHLFTASCSHHVHRGDFFGMLTEAAADSGRRIQLVEILGASADHPELLTVPETGYLKGALLRAIG